MAMKCTDCELHKKCVADTNLIQGFSKSSKPKYMVILDFATKNDAKNKSVPSGDVEHKLNYLLEKAGIDISEVAFTAAIKCPIDSKKTSKIKNEHLEACAQYLLSEIEKYKPQVLIPAGKIAFQMLSGFTSVGEFVGHDYDFTYKDNVGSEEYPELVDRKIKTFPMYSPNASLFMWKIDNRMILSLKKAKKYVETGIVERSKKPEVRTVLSLEDLQEFETEMLSLKHSATDFETSGLRFDLDEIICSGYSVTDSKAWVVFMSTYKNSHVKKWTKEQKILGMKINNFVKNHKKEIMKCLKRVHDLKIKWSLHNCKFDQKFATFNNIPFRTIYWDTMIADSLIDENEGHSLNEVYVRNDINYGPYDIKLYPYVGKKDQKTYKLIPPQKIITYLGYDVCGVHALVPIQYKELEKIGLIKHFLGRKMPTVNEVLIPMEYHGVKYDRALLIASSKNIQDRIVTTLNKLKEITKNTEFNPNSDIQISNYLTKRKFPFKKYDIPMTTRGVSTNAEAIKKVASNEKFKAFGVLLGNYKKLVKIKGTYIDGANGDKGMIQYLDTNDVLHANYNCHSPVTGRYSCLDLETEVLTNRGWLRHDEVSVSDMIFEFDTHTGELENRKILGLYKSFIGKRNMVRIYSRRYDIKVTEDHTMLFKTQNNKYKVVKAKEYKQGRNWKIINGSNFNGNFSLNDNIIKLLVATVSDGHFENNKVYFTFRKPRKINRLKEICKELGIILKELKKSKTYDSNKYEYEYRFSMDNNIGIFDGCLLDNKELSYKCLNLSVSNKKLMIEEMRLWDGDSTQKSLTFAQRKKSIVDVFSGIAATCGMRSRTEIKTDNRLNKSGIFIQHVSDTDTTHMGESVVEKTKESCQVWCVTTQSGFFVARRKGKVFITGNCSKPSLQTFPRPIEGLVNTRQFIQKSKEDLILFECDAKALEQYINAAIAEDDVLISKIKDGTDIHSFNAVTLGKSLGWIEKHITYEMFLESCGKGKTPKSELDPKIYKLFDSLRTKSKTVGFGLAYGKGAETFAKEFKMPVEEVEMMISAYFNLYKKTAKWRKATMALAISKGIIKLKSGRMRRFTMATDWLKSEHSRKTWSAKILKESIERMAINFPIQGNAHETFERGCLRLIRAFKANNLNARQIMSNHDGIVGECPKNEAEIVERLIHENMPQSFNVGTEFEISTSYEVGFYEDRWYGTEFEINNLKK